MRRSTAAREAVLMATVVALILVSTVHIRRGDPLPVPDTMSTFVAVAPPPDVPSREMSFHAHIGSLDTTVQELRLELHRRGFVDKLAHIVTVMATVADQPPAEVTAGDMERLRELVDQTVDAIEKRLEAQVDEPDVQQKLAGTIYELRRRMETIEVRFRR